MFTGRSKMALAAVAGFCVVALAGAAWPLDNGRRPVELRVVRSAEEIVAAAQRAPDFSSRSVVALNPTTLATVATGRLNATATAVLRLVPARYLICVGLPASVIAVAASVHGGLSCKPVQVARTGTSTVTFSYRTRGHASRGLRVAWGSTVGSFPPLW